MRGRRFAENTGAGNCWVLVSNILELFGVSELSELFWSISTCMYNYILKPFGTVDGYSRSLRYATRK